MEYNKEKREIILNRKLSNLDKFVLDFIKILEKHTNYVIISGYVSILLGRPRTTEDVDIFIEKIPEEKFLKFYNEIKKNGFWCLNSEDGKEIYSYLQDNLAIRFSYKGETIPNFEVKFPKDNLDKETFKDFITVILSEGKLRISCLERHIAFKKHFLKSDKDVEDALHIEYLFKEQIDYDKINKLENLIKGRNEKRVS